VETLLQGLAARYARLLFVLFFAAGSLLAPRAALADDVADEADVEFAFGAERYQAGDFRLALIHFLASNRLAKNRNVLFNIARCYEQLKQYPEAYRYYSRALVGETDSTEIAKGREAIARIAPRVALLSIETEPPGARLYLDRKDLGERGTAPQEIALPPETYRVLAELDGFEDAESEPIEITVGRERKVVLKLTRIVGTVRVQGPAGAAVRVDAENVPSVCQAPCEVKVTPGQHTIILERPGHRTLHMPVSILANAVSAMNPEMVPETGTLVINSDERDAEVLIDGSVEGFTPALINVPVGRHRVRVNSQGFLPYRREVQIRPNQQTVLKVELQSSDAVEAASRVSESAEDAPASVSLIGAQELHAMRYPTLAEALRGTRGTYLSDDRGYATVGFRGFSRPGAYGNRVLITLDGMPLNDDWLWSSYVGYDLRTDLADIERVEVVRGPGSVVYGTSAFSGVVNLVTRSKNVPSGRELGLSAAGDGTARARARITQHFGPGAGVWSSIAGGQSMGRDFFFREYVADGPPEVAGNARGVDGARFATLTGRAWWNDFTVAWSLHRHEKHLPTGQFDTLLGDGRTRQTDTRGFVEARFEPRLASTLTSLTRLHGNLYTYRGYFARSPSDDGLEYNRYDSLWAGIEQRFMWQPSPVLSASLGGESQTHPRAHQVGGTELGGEYLNDTRAFTLGAVYGNVDLKPVEGLKFSGGGRLDYYSTFGSSFNPRFAVIVKPYAGGNIKLLAGKAFKAPSIYELSYNAVGQATSQNLVPENAYSGELEVSQRIDRNLVLTGAAFANYVTDLISLDEGPVAADGSQVIQFKNARTPVGTLGGELEARRDWKDGWMVAGSYSFQHSAYLASSNLGDLMALKRAAGFREVPNAPTHLFSIRGAAPILSRALTVMSRLSYEGQRYDTNDTVNASAPQGRTDGALIWDFVFTGFERRLGLDYSVGVYNAFDSRAGVPVSTEFRQRTIPIAGRSLLASGSVTF
jgi:outer membrane receptor protein involved in Fe transport